MRAILQAILSYLCAVVRTPKEVPVISSHQSCSFLDSAIETLSYIESTNTPSPVQRNEKGNNGSILSSPEKGISTSSSIGRQ